MPIFIKIQDKTFTFNNYQNFTLDDIILIGFIKFHADNNSNIENVIKNIGFNFLKKSSFKFNSKRYYFSYFKNSEKLDKTVDNLTINQHFLMGQEIYFSENEKEILLKKCRELSKYI